MDDSNELAQFPPFPWGYRASGLLHHVTSLPSPYGIGDLGPGAFAWVDRLHDSGQQWWQALPLGPTGYANSPYQCLSSFVGNGLLISPELLILDGLLKEHECEEAFSSTTVDYNVVIPFKQNLLPLIWARFKSGERRDLWPEYEQFCYDRASWLDDYALFRALKARFQGAWYLDWPDELVQRVPSALAQARQALHAEVDQIRLSQFLLSRQSSRLKDYANAKGIRLIGDLPFFVSPDSSDIWANPELFLLDERRHPRFVAGVPPDYFSAQGQRWGNPVYDWKALQSTGFAWWIERIRALLRHVDLIRLDHFRAFAAAWHVRTGAPTAASGSWEPGPGAEFFAAVKAALGNLPFVAEDLGLITPDVSRLRDQFQLPGTRVLQFAFDGRGDNPHLPDNYPSNTVVYTGTHDNNTTRAWFADLTEPEQRRVWTYLKRPQGEPRDVTPELIRTACFSPAAIAITPLQDLLNLGRDARMNTPGQALGNWQWRATPHQLAAWNFQWLRELTRISNRSGTANDPAVRSASGSLWRGGE